jgi:hypothetical protein
MTSGADGAILATFAADDVDVADAIEFFVVKDTSCV